MQPFTGEFGYRTRRYKGAAWRGVERAIIRYQRFFHGFPTRLQEGWHSEAGRLDLWIPVFLGFGIAVYFRLPAEPPLWLSFMIPVTICLIWQASRRVIPDYKGIYTQPETRPRRYTSMRAGLPIACNTLFIASLGFLLSDLRTDYLETPVLAEETRSVTVEGRLLSLEDRDKRRRLVIEIDKIEGLRDQVPPARIRVTWRGAPFAAQPGDRIRIRAVLDTPPGPVMPGAFDFARQLYFQKIGAIGYALGPPEIRPGEATGIRDMIGSRIAALRLSLMRRILTATAPHSDGGGIAAALVTGKRDAIPAYATEALRDAGLAHLLAISGLHMGLVTGLMFFLARYFLASIEFLALRYPIKKWAAVIALIAGAAYLVLSGGAWSARRAYIMAAVMFCAILANRRALSMRNVALAASLMLITTPEAILSAGFQMSFAAVIVIIAYAEWWQARRWRPHIETPKTRWAKWRKSMREYFISLSVVSIISGISTGIFAIFHFNHVANYGLLANLLAMPLVSIWVVPMALFAVAVMPLGIDGLFWLLMAFGLEIIIDISVWTQSIPGAVFLTRPMPEITLYLLIAAGLIFCLFRSVIRWASVCLLPFALIPYAFSSAPDILVSHEGRNVAIRLKADAGYAFLSRQRDRFAGEMWLRRAGYRPEISRMPRIDEIGICDIEGCVMHMRGDHLIAVSKRPAALNEDCMRADLIITLYPVDQPVSDDCAPRIISASFGREADTLSVRVSEDGQTNIDRVHKRRIGRPWSARYRMGNGPDGRAGQRGQDNGPG